MAKRLASNSIKHRHAVVVCSIIGRRGLRVTGPHTLKEILQDERPAIWEASEKSIDILKDWQKKTIELLPTYKKRIPNSIEQLQGEDAHTYLNYLKLCLIYDLAEYLWQSVDVLCHDLAKGLADVNIDEIEKNEDGLNLANKFIDILPVFQIIQDDTIGFYRLYPFWDVYFRNHLVNVFPHQFALFYDIYGSIQYNGIKVEWIWERVTKSQVPTAPSIAGLMEKPEDNKMVRVY